MQRMRKWLTPVVVLAAVLAGCGGDDDTEDSNADSTELTDSADDSSTAGDDSADGATVSTDNGDDSSSVEDDSTAASADSSNGGTLTLGAENIAFDSARCFLEEQDAAAGGGKILFVVQAFGVNAEGEDVMIDVSRFDEDSQFTGDDILVDIGDPFSGDSVSWGANAELGTVQIDGSIVSADGLTFMNFDDAEELPGSFSINC